MKLRYMILMLFSVLTLSLTRYDQMPAPTGPPAAERTIPPAEEPAEQLSTATPTPTLMVLATLDTLYYSYYYPDLLAEGEVVDGKCTNEENGICHTVNCFDYDLATGRCRSPMSTGLDWHEYLGKSVACGYEYPLGTVFRVVTPESLAGDYPCLDRCPDCTGKQLLDFLSTIQLLPWQTPIQVQVIR